MTWNPEKAIAQYSELHKLISVGAYQERDHTGAYGKDGIEEKADTLIFEAARRGLAFCWEITAASWTLLPMSAEEKAAFLHVNVEKLVSILAESSRYLNTFPYESGLEKSSRLGLLERIKNTVEQSYLVPVVREELPEPDASYYEPPYNELGEEA